MGSRARPWTSTSSWGCDRAASSGFERIALVFRDEFLVNEPIEIGGRWMASLVATSARGKVDIFIGRGDPWGQSAMDGRQRGEHPAYGSLWIASLEDLVLAKLEWSEGTSELQLRDVRNLVVANAKTIDWPYLERWAGALGVVSLLESVRHAI